MVPTKSSREISSLVYYLVIWLIKVQGGLQDGWQPIILWGLVDDLFQYLLDLGSDEPLNEGRISGPK